jgi:hypothetical protein
MKTTASKLTQLAILAAAAFLFMGAAQEGDRMASAREVEQLRGLVTMLETKVATMETRIRKLESRGFSQRPPPVSRIPGRPGADVPLTNQDLPKIWGKGECNGWPFYIIPIQSR